MLCWQFLCKMHGRVTANTRKLETHKVKDKEGNLVIVRQCNTMIKVKKDYWFEYILSYKAVSKGSSKKEYIRTFKCFKYIYLIYINFFLFKIYKIKIIKY